MSSQTSSSVPQGWLERIKEQLDLTSVINQLTLQKASEYLLYFGSGLLVGFVIRRYGKLFIFLVLLLAVALWGLQNLGIVTVNVAQIKALLGLQEQGTVHMHIQQLLTWAKEHIGLAVSVGVGCFVGSRLG